MKAYPAYKESGIEWIGEIPDHWNLSKLKWLSTKIGSGVTPRGGAEIYQETGIPLIRSQNVHFDGLRLDDVVFISDEIYESMSRSAIQSNDVLLNITGASIGRCALVPEPFQKANVNQHVCIVRTEDARLSKYLHLFLCSEIGQMQVMNSQNGAAREGLNYEQLGNFAITLPSPPEREAIVDYLDRKTAVIDSLIAKKERQIELLQEQRTAVINTAVTKGLDPYAPLKDSHSHFYPPVPQHWSVTKLGYLCHKVSDGPHFSPSYVEEGVMFLSARNIKPDRWSLDDAKYISEEDYEEFCKRIIPEKGDILYTKGGTTGIARVVDLEQRFQVWVHVAVLKIYHEKVNPYFLAYTLNGSACYDQSQLYTRGATNNDLGLTRMINIVLGLPPMSEQNAIVEHLNIATSKIDNLIIREQELITKLQEYRTAVISAAVTGKIDVREAS